MAASRSATATLQSVSSIVPTFYRIVLTTVEPILTLLGVTTTIGNPMQYIHALAGPQAPDVPQLHFLYTQLCGAWLAMGLNGAVLLRVSDDVNVWMVYALGMFVSDIVYTHSCAQAMGGWSNFVQLNHWRAMDWVIFFGSMPLAIVRLFFLLKVGFRAPANNKRAKSKK